VKRNEKRIVFFTVILIISIAVSIFRLAVPVREDGDFLRKGGLPQVLVLDLIGAIQFGTSKAILQYLEEVEQNSAIRGVILQINSPGGTVASSQEIYAALMRLRQKGIKIVVGMGDIAASGGYYIASAADQVVANPGTITGSIGVIIAGWDFTEIMDKIGVKSVIIKSGKMKDLLSPFKKMSEQEREHLKEMVLQAYEQFIGDILKGREGKISEEELRKIADGRVVNGDTAKQKGLVDKIGGRDTVRETMKELLKSPEVKYVHPKKMFFEQMMKQLLSNQNDWLFNSLKLPVFYYYGGAL
jgi:protease-4